MKKVLVTGGAGYIGSHTCKLLAKSGYEPITLDNLSTGHEEFVKWGPLEIIDLSDTQRITEIIKHYAPSAIIHFAAKAYVGESIKNPLKYYNNNVGGTLSLVAAMREAGLDKIVFSSSCATYGASRHRLITEETPQIPISPYGHSKLMIERIFHDLSNRDELKYFSLRYFNAAGADIDCEIGEWHEPETHLIPLAIRSARGGNALNIYGTDFDTPDGSAVRDYVHVEDLAVGHILALQHLIDGGPSAYVNLGTGTGSSIFDIIAALRKLSLDVEFIRSDRREGDPPYLVADITKARETLGWAPKYAEIIETLKTAAKWDLMRSNNVST